MGEVRLFQSGYFLLGEAQLQRRNCILKVVRLCGANDWGSDAWLLEHPRERDLRVADPALLRNVGHPIDDHEVRLLIVHLPAELIALAPRGNGFGALPVSREESTGQRT